MSTLSCPTDWSFTGDKGPAIGYGRADTQDEADLEAKADAEKNADKQADQAQARHTCEGECTAEFKVKKSDATFYNQQQDPNTKEFVSTAEISWRLFIRCVESEA